MSMGWMSRLGVTAVVTGGVAFGLSGVAAITAPDGGADAPFAGTGSVDYLAPVVRRYKVKN